jgi:broad specificity phosphatase PhoE
MDEFLLVRHAATSWTGRRYCGRSDPPLSDAGRAAAGHLAAELASSLPPGIRIVSSPLLRARQTAAVIAAAVPAAALAFDDRWSETDFGIAEGLTFDELMGIAPDIAARLADGHVAIDWPGGETAASLTARVEAAWRELIGHGTTALVVSHGGPLRIAIARATKLEVGDVTVPEPGTVWRLPIRLLTPIARDP